MKLSRRGILGLAAPIAVSSAAAAVAATEPESPPIRAIMHVAVSDQDVFDDALGSVSTMFSAADRAARTLFVKLVVNHGGLDMVRLEKTPLSTRLSIMEVEHPNFSVFACGRTLYWAEKAAGHSIPLLEMVQMTDSGALYMAELQNEGWAYLRP